MMVKLSKCDVKIKDVFTWGDKEKLQSVYIKGAKIDQTGMKEFDASVVSEAKYTLLEMCVVEIKEEDKVIPFSKEWMNSLSVDDGDKLYEAVEELSGSKKKV